MLEAKVVVFRLLLSILLSSIIGLDRESINKPAGLRTHVLVSLASTLIMLISIYINELYSSGYYFSDRLASQVISGIGFLGAGTILRKDKGIITGLTTAASLWAVATIGLAVGIGFYLGAFLATILVIITLIVFQKLGSRISRKGVYVTGIRIVSVDKPGQIGEIGKVLGKYGVNIIGIDIENKDNRLIVIDLEVSIKKLDNKYELINSLAVIEDIIEISQYN